MADIGRELEDIAGQAANRISDLEEQLKEKENDCDELEDRVEELKERIRDLEQELEKLQETEDVPTFKTQEITYETY